MSELNLLFRKRIGIPINEEITFDRLDTVLEKAARSIPFENLCMIEKRHAEITKEGLTHKIVKKNEGGLCYELNPLLNFFLAENGFKTSLIHGVVYDHHNEQWSVTGQTHVANLINYNGHRYLIDTGFGGNLPLKPVPLNGETVISANGEFRVQKEKSEHGDYILYMKLRYKDRDWKKGYAFHSEKEIENMSELNVVQKVIAEHPHSPFNKKPLLTRMTDNGNIILTENSFIEWVNGKMKKEEIDQEQFREIVKEHFHMSH